MDILENEKKEALDFVRVAAKHRFLILGFVFLVTILTLIVTLVVPKKYTSSAIIFPTESNSLDDVIRNPQFGYDIEADRLIQILESRSIRDSIIKKFNLVNYFEIDTTKKDWQDILRKKYLRAVSYSKTRFMSVIISAKTTDPILSANIANAIILLVDQTRERLLKQNLDPTIRSLRTEYEVLQADLDSLSGVVDRMTGKRKGVKQFVQADRNISLIMDKDQLGDEQASKAIQTVVNLYNVKLSWLYDVQTRLKNAILVRERPLPSVYVVENAVPSYKKSSPHLLTNLAIAICGSLIFISFGLFLFYRIRSLPGYKEIK